MSERSRHPSFRGAPTGSRKARPDGANPESSGVDNLWIPGWLASNKIDYVNFVARERPGMTRNNP
jgi:hypothetical protein